MQCDVNLTGEEGFVKRPCPSSFVLNRAAAGLDDDKL